MREPHLHAKTRILVLNENSCFWKNNVYDVCFTKLKNKQKLNILFKYTKLVKTCFKKQWNDSGIQIVLFSGGQGQGDRIGAGYKVCASQ